MRRPARHRDVPLRFDDNFRGHIASLISFAAPAAVFVQLAWAGDLPRNAQDALNVAFLGLCAGLSMFFAVYVAWTHRLFQVSDPAEAARIAAIQHRRPPSRLAQWSGFGGTLDWALSAAGIALVVSVAGTIIAPQVGTGWGVLLVLVTTTGAWATVVYAFALRYFRLHCSGERIDFDIDEEPQFIDFVSMAVMVSSVGAMSAGTPRTRAGLSTVRSHTALAFVFNAFVVAMVVTLVAGLITAR